MTTYLVAGACGFIGSNFVHFLRAERPGDGIVAVDNLGFASNPANLDAVIDDIDLEVADICDFEAMTAIYERYRPEVVVNFAAESHNDRAVVTPSDFARSNALGCQSLLEASRKVPVRRHVHVSTIEVYGELPAAQRCFDESSPLNAKTPYSAAKAAGDLFVRAYMQTYPEMDIVLTHCANNYGPYQFPEKLIPLVITNVVRGRKAPVYGDGLQKRDWLHVRDHCRAILAMVHAPKVEITAAAATDAGRLPIYDISARNELTNLELVSRIIRLLGKEPDEWIEHVADRPNHDRRYLIDPAKIEAELGWKAEIDFDTGLEQTVRWYVDNPEWWQAILERSGSLQFDWSAT
ncbi:MAG TPA: dTDP-glucose 4,6-dehydratase [Acidobacteriota bacterium]